MGTRAVRLRSHPQTPCAAVDEVVADVDVTRDVLVVRYAIVGDLDRVRIPATSLDPERLWAHTCCELFVAPSPGEGYLEWNFSPNGQIACFAFTAYRQRSPSAPTSSATSTVRVAGRELTLEARVPLPADVGELARMSLTAVVEDDGGTLSYWALRHPGARPDFHHEAGFALTLTLAPSIAIVDR